jgi:hypothetical protein
MSAAVAEQKQNGHSDVTVLSSTTVLQSAAAAAVAAVPTKKIMLTKRNPKGSNQSEASSEEASGALKQMSLAEKEKVLNVFTYHCSISCDNVRSVSSVDIIIHTPYSSAVRVH